MCKISGYIIKSFSFITLFFSWINTDYYICAWQDMHCRLTKANKKKKASICGSLHNSTIPLILLLIVWKAWWFRKQSPNRVCRTCMTSDWTFHHRYWFCDFILCQMYLKELDEQFLQLHKIPRWVTRYCWLKETHDMKKSWETWNIYKVWIRQKPKHGYILYNIGLSDNQSRKKLKCQLQPLQYQVKCERPFQVTRKEPKLSQSDKMLYKWCTTVHSEGKPMTWPIRSGKKLSLYHEIVITDKGTFSEGWL